MQQLLACRESIRSSLARETLRSSGRLCIRVFGTSMLGTVWPGDIVIFEPCSVDDLWPGEIVLYQRDGRLIAHRLVEISSNRNDLTLVTRGDSLRANDLPLAVEELLGRAVVVQRPGRKPRQLPADKSTLQRLLSWMAARSSLFCELALRVHSSCTWLAACFVPLRDEGRQTILETQS
jgi:signal peptidase I